MKWHSLTDFSFKDLISIFLIISFIGTLIYALVSKDSTVLSLVSTQVPIVIATLGLYGGSELFANRYQYQQNYNQTPTSTSYSSMTSPVDNNSTVTNPSSEGSV